MDDFDLTDRNYHELLRLADRLGEPSDKNFETWGGDLSAHTDPTSVTSPLWADQSAEDRFAEACRRHPRIADLWRTARRQAERRRQA